jgi:hypothetical protein
MMPYLAEHYEKLLDAERAAHERTRAELAEREARVAELTAALDRDQTGLANALAAIKQRVGAGWWITEGRGSYAWDDDRYRRETAIVLGDVAELASKALHASGDIANQALVDTPLATWAAARELRKRLDAAIAREQAAQDEAAAMREALFQMHKYHSHGPVVLSQMAAAALDGTAGRALAARVPLWRELEDAARRCDAGATAVALRKLAALDAKEPK